MTDEPEFPHMDVIHFDDMDAMLAYVGQKASDYFQIAIHPNKGGYTVSTPKFKEKMEAA